MQSFYPRELHRATRTRGGSVPLLLFRSVYQPLRLLGAHGPTICIAAFPLRQRRRMNKQEEIAGDGRMLYYYRLIKRQEREHLI